MYTHHQIGWRSGLQAFPTRVEEWVNRRVEGLGWVLGMNGRLIGSLLGTVCFWIAAGAVIARFA